MHVGPRVSPLAVVARYVDQCQSLHAERLRAICDAELRNAERLLTLDFSRFLVTAGVSPVIDATIGELGRDSASSTLSFYVEAKHYRTANPGIPIQRAFAQMWGAWGRLRRVYRSFEAFLVIFRRGGRMVDLPPVIAFGELQLYSMVADIAVDGSREYATPVQLSEASLRPGPQAPVPGARARRSGSARRSRR